jgi:hypothetical protein
MSLDSFESLLRHPAPAFECAASGRRFIAPVRHDVSPPAPGELLSRIPEIPGSAAAREFYARSNGALLFAAPPAFRARVAEAPDAGIEIFSIEQWDEKTRENVDEWAQTAEDGFDEALPYTRDDFIAIGHPRGSWNYFHWVIRGPAAGRVFWWAWTMPPWSADDALAPNFRAFVGKICSDTASLVEEVFFAGYTNYWDGSTDTQWVPHRYVPDARLL